MTPWRPPTPGLGRILADHSPCRATWDRVSGDARIFRLPSRDEQGQAEAIRQIVARKRGAGSPSARRSSRFGRGDGALPKWSRTDWSAEIDDSVSSAIPELFRGSCHCWIVVGVLIAAAYVAVMPGVTALRLSPWCAACLGIARPAQQLRTACRFHVPLRKRQPTTWTATVGERALLNQGGDQRAA